MQMRDFLAFRCRWSWLGWEIAFHCFYMTIQFLLSTERTVTRGAHEGFRPTTGRVFKQVFASSERLFACRTYMADRWLHVTV